MDRIHAAVQKTGKDFMLFSDLQRALGISKDQLIQALSDLSRHPDLRTQSGHSYDFSGSTLLKNPRVERYKINGTDTAGIRFRPAPAAEAASVAAPVAKAPAGETFQQEVDAFKALTNGRVQPSRSAPLREVFTGLDFGSLTGLHGAISRFMRDHLSRLVGDIPVHFITPKEMNRVGQLKGAIGKYSTTDKGRDFITIDSTLLRHPQDLLRTVLHEAVHAATRNAIDKNPIARAAVRLLMDETESVLRKANMHEQVAGHKKYGALQNEHEFLAEARSDPNVQEMLAVIPTPPKLAAELKALGYDITTPSGKLGSMWDTFIGVIRNLVGLPKQHTTLLEAVMRVSKDIDQPRSWNARPQEAVAKTLPSKAREGEGPKLSVAQKRAANEEAFQKSQFENKLRAAKGEGQITKFDPPYPEAWGANRFPQRKITELPSRGRAGEDIKTELPSTGGPKPPLTQVKTDDGRVFSGKDLRTAAAMALRGGYQLHQITDMAGKSVMGAMAARRPPPVTPPTAAAGGAGAGGPPPGASSAAAAAGAGGPPPTIPPATAAAAAGVGQGPLPPPPRRPPPGPGGPGAGGPPPGAGGPPAAAGAGGPGGPAGPGAAPVVAPRTLVPATASDLNTGILATLRRQFGGLFMRGSESAQIGQAALKAAAGPLARIREQTAHQFSNDMHRLANRMDRPAFERFVDAYESGNVHTLPADQQRLARVLKENYDRFWNEISRLPGAHNRQAVLDYLTHMYSNNNNQVNNFVNDWYGAGGGSLRQRTHPTYADARAAGLEPLSNNPIEHFIRYSEGISHYMIQRRLLDDIEGQNRLGWFAPRTVGASGTPQPLVRGRPPDGYVELKPPWAEDMHGRRAYAPRDIAETINQFYDAGLQRNETGNIYEFMRQTKNMWTAVELGLSAYHATTMIVESVASGMARAMMLARSGDYAGATKHLVSSMTLAEPVLSAMYGRIGRQIYRDPTGTVGTPLQRRIMDILTQANIQPGNLRITGEYDMSRLGNFWDAQRRGSLGHEFQTQLRQAIDSYGLRVPGILLENLRRAMQTISKPLFEHFIPALKVGTMMKDMEAWFKFNPNATDAQALTYARRVADSMDNRMGEMNYDNLFINKTAKQVGILALRSFGFTVGGPIREIGAGIGRFAGTAARGRDPTSRLDLRSANADPGSAYGLAFLPAIAFLSAAYQYMRTGKGPEEWRDLVTPKTGGTIASVGKQVPERVLVPGYHKDFLGYFVNPEGASGELTAKLAAPWTTLWEQYTGKDWKHQNIVPPRATLLENLQARGKAVGSHMLPIGPKQLYEGTRPGSALTIPEQLLGSRTPGAYMLNPAGLEKFLSERQHKEWQAEQKRVNRERARRGLPPEPLRQLPKSPWQ